ncbi:MAG TPA: histidinol-phosphate transaminase, partial [Candidatus Limnocylindrales bacterium]|nr:histidinol-phosphate transaminase [Candidatus Limnocylindrales bacterium]
GRAAVVPVPTYAMFRVVTEQRGARAVLVPRRGPESGWAFEPDAVRTAACDADLVWLCSPNNPTGLPEPEGAIEDLLGALEADAAAAARPAPVVVVDEAYAEFTGRTLLPARSRYPRLVVVRTMSKAYGLAGLRVGFALARPEVIALIAPYRPPGSVSVVSVAAAAEALAEPGWVAENVARVASERERLATVFAAAGWPADPSVTNFLLVRFGTPERTARIAEALLRRGLVPRTFPAGHPLAAALRITVRSAAENDRLAEAIEALAEVTDDGATEGTVRAATVPPAGADARAAVRPAPAVETEEADR